MSTKIRRVIVSSALSLALCGTTNAAPHCRALWSEFPGLKEVDSPIWVTPSIPSFGDFAVPRMVVLHYSGNMQFVPRSIRESNCYLDRVLDPILRKAMFDGAMIAVRMGVDLPRDEQIELLQREISERMRREAGLPDEVGDVLYLSVLSNLRSAYGIRPAPVKDAGPFLQFAYGERLFSEYTIKWYVLLTYLNYLGVNGIVPKTYLDYFRDLDISYAPPPKGAETSCKSGIAYEWPHIGTALSAQPNVPDTENVHYGVCSYSSTVWRFHYKDGWQLLSAIDMRKFCEGWAHDPYFSLTCARYEKGRR